MFGGKPVTPSVKKPEEKEDDGGPGDRYTKVPEVEEIKKEDWVEQIKKQEEEEIAIVIAGFLTYLN